MSDHEIEERNSLKRLDYLEAIGIQPLNANKFGKDRGLTPKVSEAQQREIAKLAARLSYKNSDIQKSGDEDVDQTFDILSTPRVILYEGKVSKKSEHLFICMISIL